MSGNVFISATWIINNFNNFNNFKNIKLSILNQIIKLSIKTTNYQYLCLETSSNQLHGLDHFLIF